MPDIVIYKKDGTQEIFNEEKLIRSLKKSNASEGEVEHVVQLVYSKLAAGMRTTDIYRLAHSALSSYQKKNPNAIKYSLKQCVMELGPSGFPFESFVSRIFIELGYTCKTGVMLRGHCIEHEVDVLAHKGDEVICIEAKFHNESYLKSDTKVALYVKARFDDLIGQKITIDGQNAHITKGMLVTNTNFTDSAHVYADCIGTYEMLSWNRPQNKNLLTYIEEFKLYPITIIPELSKREILQMIEMGVLMCNDIKSHKNILNKLNIKPRRQQAIYETINSICKC